MLKNKEKWEKTFVCLLKQRSGYFCQERFWNKDILTQLEQLEDVSVRERPLMMSDFLGGWGV